MNTIKRILVANRGEIVVRVTRSCRGMEITSIAVFSETDRTAKHMLYADEIHCIGPAVSKESYLNIEKIIEVAKPCCADAIYLGYGFLSENATFARRRREEGTIFIGPDPETMEAMGDKILACAKMIEASVPVVPGTRENLKSLEEAVELCNQIGYPVMPKASMGGGEKGIRLIHRADEVEEVYTTAKSESLSLFGDDTVYLEKFVEEPHHIEFQILGNKYGNVIHLYERECSVQRRNQKIVGESPSVFVTPELRRDMGERVVATAKAVNYTGAGTIEFLVDRHRNYYFLEMNTRLQVEHPIIEEVAGVDLVKEQTKVAEGQALQLKQEDIQQRGHVIECRICMEDTGMNFMPSPDVIKQITESSGTGVRIDSYVYEGYEIPIYYDPMIGKLVVWATTREHVIERMCRVLHEYELTGVKNNISYLRAIMDTPDFVEGHYDAGFVGKGEGMLQHCITRTSERAENITLIVAYMDYLMNLEENNSGLAVDNRPISKWKEFGLHKGVLRIQKNVGIHIGNHVAEIELVSKENNRVVLTIDGKTLKADVVTAENGNRDILMDGRSSNAQLICKEDGGSCKVNTHYSSFNVEIVDSQTKRLQTCKKGEETQNDRTASPMPGKVVKILVSVGQGMKTGKTVIVTEAMKMQSNYKTTSDCRIKEILVQEGDNIVGDQTLMTLE